MYHKNKYSFENQTNSYSANKCRTSLPTINHDDSIVSLNDDQRLQYWINKENATRPTDTVNMLTNQTKSKHFNKKFSVSNGHDIFNTANSESNSRSQSPQKMSMINHAGKSVDPLTQSISIGSKSRADVYNNIISDIAAKSTPNNMMYRSSDTRNDIKSFAKVNGISDGTNKANVYNANYNQDFQVSYKNNPDIFRRSKGM